MFEIFNSSKSSSIRNTPIRNTSIRNTSIRNTPSPSNELVDTSTNSESWLELIKDGEMSMLNMVASLESFNAWLDDNETPIDANGWISESSNILANYPSYRSLVTKLLSMNGNVEIVKDEKSGKDFYYNPITKKSAWNRYELKYTPPLRVAVSDDASDCTKKANEWDYQNRFVPDEKAMVDAGGSRALYSIVQLSLRSGWKGISKEKDGITLQVSKSKNTQLGQDSLGNYWACINFTQGIVSTKLRITYLQCDPLPLSELVKNHSTAEGLEPYTQSGGIFSSAKPNPTDAYKGVRFTSVKRELSTVGMRPILGCQNERWICAGAQANGLFQLNNEGLNLEVTSVVVATYRSCSPSVNSDGYLEFFQKVGRNKLFTCLYEVLVDSEDGEKLVFATLCNQDNMRGADQ